MYIYIAQEKESGKVYVGATTIGLEHRIADHYLKGKKGLGSKFQKVLNELGKDAFEWIIIDEATTKSELAHKERQYIIGYNSLLDGFNSDRGGGIQKSVYQYNIETKELINSFNSLKEASEEVGADKKQISKACNSISQKFGGFYWSYSKLPYFARCKDIRDKSLCQYTLEGISIACFSSVAEASRATGVNRSCIAKVCRGERNVAGGYSWQFE